MTQETNNFKKVDAKKYVDELKQNGVDILEAAKFARVIARQGIVGEQITTYVDTGIAETVNTVKLEKNSKTGEEKPGYVITMADSQGNPIIDLFGHTNTYIIPAETFEKKYEPDEKDGVFKPKGGPQLFMQIPENISIIASWGEEQNLEAGAFLNVLNDQDIYGIAYSEFQQTYAWTDNVSIEQISKLISPNTINKENKEIAEQEQNAR